MMNTLESVFGYFRYSPFGLVYLTSAFFNISVGTVVLLKDRHNPIHRSFFFVTLTAFIWTTSIGMIDLTADMEKAHFWLRAQYFIGVPFISPSVYLFSSLWVGKKNNFVTYLGFFFASIASFLYCFLTDSVWVINDRWWGRYPSYVLTPFGISCITFLLIYFFIYAFMAFNNCYRGWKNSKNPRERAQFRNILIGFLIAYTGACDFIAAFDINVFPFGFIPLTILMGIIAYTMLKHEFLNINLILKKGFLLLLIYSALLAVVMPAAIPLAIKISHEALSHPLITILGYGLIVGIILSFGPVIYAYLARHNFWLRDTMSTGLAHELKSPLGAIQGALELVSRQMKSPGGNNEKTLEYLELIQRNTDRLENYVKDLLNLSQIEKGEVSIEKTQVDFTNLVGDVLERFQPIFIQKGLKIEFSQAHPFPVFLDKQKIEQVISNLLSNAIRYSDQGTIRIQIKKQSETIHCIVVDEGRGVSQKNLNRIFDRFFQEGKSSKGSGIGLTIAKSWVEAHGGKIWAESEGEGKGTKVTFTLPI